LPSVLLPFSTTPSAGLNGMPKQFACPSSQFPPSSSQPLIQLLPQQTLDQSQDEAFHQEVHPSMTSFGLFLLHMKLVLDVPTVDVLENDGSLLTLELTFVICLMTSLLSHQIPSSLDFGQSL
jgi:hypothetical protein